MNIKIIFLGTPEFVQPIKDVLARHFTLVDSLNDADLGVIAAYGSILTKEELNKPKYGCINIHPSLLPKYRGPSPIQSAILAGDKTSGITIIKMDKEIDHGSIIYQEELELSDYDNFDTLSTKMFLRASEILPKIINKFVAGAIEDFAQDDRKATFCKILTRDSGFFDINNPPPPEKLDRMIRAYHPWPGVWTRWCVRCHGSCVKQDTCEFKIVKFYPDGKIQMEGKKVISMKDFLNGYPDFPINN